MCEFAWCFPHLEDIATQDWLVIPFGLSTKKIFYQFLRWVIQTSNELVLANKLPVALTSSHIIARYSYSSFYSRMTILNLYVAFSSSRFKDTDTSVICDDHGEFSDDWFMLSVSLALPRIYDSLAHLSFLRQPEGGVETFTNQRSVHRLFPMVPASKNRKWCIESKPCWHTTLINNHLSTLQLSFLTLPIFSAPPYHMSMIVADDKIVQRRRPVRLDRMISMVCH